MSEWELAGKSPDELHVVVDRLRTIDSARAFGVIFTWRDEIERVSVERDRMALELEAMHARLNEAETELAEYE